jgi:hypothetical protein
MAEPINGKPTDFHRFTKKICVELCSLWTENLVNGVT